MLEEAPRSYADLCHDAAETIDRVNDPLRDDALAQRFELTRLARIVAELAQRLAGDVETLDTDDDPNDDGGRLLGPDDIEPDQATRYAVALDQLAALVGLPEWQIRGSGASWIECAADVVRLSGVTIPDEATAERIVYGEDA